MTATIRTIIESMIAEGYLLNYIIGTREQMTSNDAVTFRFDIPKYRIDAHTKQRVYTLTYVVGQPSQQDSNDIEGMTAQIKYCDKVNILFIDKLMAYENEAGQQVFELLQEVDVKEFADLKMLEYPTTGLFCEIRINNHSPIHCTWKD
jgi:hypothetical protein